MRRIDEDTEELVEMWEALHPADEENAERDPLRVPPTSGAGAEHVFRSMKRYREDAPET